MSETAAQERIRKKLAHQAAYAGQYQQRPAPAGGAIFQRGWFPYYDELPSGLEIAQSWDMAFKDNKDNDYVVGLVAGRRGADIYVIDRVKGQWAFSESCRQVEALTRKYPDTGKILIEDAANGPAIIDALTHRIPGDHRRLARGRQARARASGATACRSRQCMPAQSEAARHAHPRASVGRGLSVSAHRVPTWGA